MSVKNPDADTKQELVQVASKIQNETWSTISKECVEANLKNADERASVQIDIETPSKTSSTALIKSDLAEERRPVTSVKEDAASAPVAVGSVRPHWRLALDERMTSKERDTSQVVPSTETFFKVDIFHCVLLVYILICSFLIS
ncbi:unnamed protein product [Strongylus vulgaris]|uniref:Uncharacterized protein n=1 Tax=Strongylus vulgaris TaxID=40348 RepID=A0A3P7IIF9_STRVU|nr:unnamed protein product [Strongylus vulgaris]